MLTSRLSTGLVLLIAGIAAVAACMPALNEWLAYERASVLHCQWWRIASSQLAHHGASHFGWNVAAFTALGLVTSRSAPRATAACIALGLLTLPLVVLALRPDIEHFRGLSGVATALFALLAWKQCREARGAKRVASLAIVLLFAAKCAVELIGGSAVFVAGATFVVVPEVHIAGAMIGAALAEIASFQERASFTMHALSPTP